MNARFLSTSEKRTILKYVSVNGTGISNTYFETSQAKAVFLDPQVWLLFLSNTTISISAAILGSFGATIIRGLGYSPKQSALLNMLAGAISFTVVLLCAFVIRYNILTRFWAIIISLCLSLIGTTLVAFLTRSNHAGSLAGLWMVNISSVCA